MNKSQKVYMKMQEVRLIGLLSPESTEACIAAYEVLTPLNIVLEIAARTANAIQSIKGLLVRYPDALILAGTIVSPAQVDALAEMGIAGIISPDYIPDVLESCVKYDLLYAPGGLSAVGTQLAHKARLYGCGMDDLRTEYAYQYIHKLFPAYTATNNFTGLAKAWAGPYKGLQMMYTGGVNKKRLPELVKADPEGIFCGSAMTRSVADPEKMKAEAENWINVLRACSI